MNKLVKILPAVLLMFSLSIVGCSDDDSEETCNKNDSNIGTCSADDITACCDDSGSCYFIYQGTEYASAGDLAAVCQSSSAMQLKAIEMELDAITQQLINEARTAALCD
ncbi:hypothetical protein [Carboxylicivirga sp. RSCT41]|uniref:hypothetical protein n=1 Tax=Carboxylicivirga agarovorans TaxID=3417570 RepID=UPI003D332EBD